MVGWGLTRARFHSSCGTRCGPTSGKAGTHGSCTCCLRLPEMCYVEPCSVILWNHPLFLLCPSPLPQLGLTVQSRQPRTLLAPASCCWKQICDPSKLQEPQVTYPCSDPLLCSLHSPLSLTQGEELVEDMARLLDLPRAIFSDIR